MKKTRISGKIKYRFEHSSEDSRNELRMSALQGWKWREKRIFMDQNDYGKRKAVCRHAAGFMAAVMLAAVGTASMGVCV